MDCVGVHLQDCTINAGDGAWGPTGTHGTSTPSERAPDGTPGANGAEYSTGCNTSWTPAGSGAINGAEDYTRGGDGGLGGSMDTACFLGTCTDCASRPGYNGYNAAQYGTNSYGYRGNGGDRCEDGYDGADGHSGQDGQPGQGATGGYLFIGDVFRVYPGQSGRTAGPGTGGGCDWGTDSRGGGDGGDGGAGQPGGLGGSGGFLDSPDPGLGGDGGDGGRGGITGSGGGGRGGCAVGIAGYVLGLSQSDVDFQGGTAGRGGSGGACHFPGSPGPSGLVLTTLTGQSSVAGANAADKLTACDLHACLVSGVGDDPDLPVRVALRANVPNPFNPVTEIRFDLPAAGGVEIGIYDLTGRRVRHLVADTVYPAGRHGVVWNGRSDAG